MSQKLTAQAINELAPNAEYTIIDGVIDWQSEEINQPSNEAIEAKKLQINYKNNRQVAYASIQDQLDMQYWDNVNGTTTWKDHIAKVKSDNPKP